MQPDAARAAIDASRAGRPAWVVVPAKDEQEHIGAAIHAIATAAARARGGAVHLVIVDDGSTDATESIVREELAAWRHGTAQLLAGRAAGVGWARRIGLDHALAAAVGRRDALIATTDADSRVPANWLAALHARVDEGHAVIAGDISLDTDTDPRLAAAREQRLTDRLALVREVDRAADHPHFAGANLAWTAEALARLTPLPTPTSLEDDALRRRCESIGLPILRDGSFPVLTSARTDGRAAVGLASALADDQRRLGLVPASAAR